MKFNTIIVGAGIAGLYTAYKLVNQDNLTRKDLAIFEMSDYVGGRTHTQFSSQQYPLDLGAGRFHTCHHPLLNKLIHELGLETKDFRYASAVTEPSLKASIIAHHKNIVSLKVNNANAIFTHVIINNFGINYLNQLASDLGYDVLLNNTLPFTEALRIINDHPEMKVSYSGDLNPSKWRQLSLGFQSVANALHSQLIKSKLSIYFTNELVSIDETDQEYHLTFYNKGIITSYITQNVILAIPQNALKRLIPVIPAIKAAIDSVTTVPLFKLYLLFKDSWWEYICVSNHYYKTTSLPLRRIYFSSLQNEIIIYCDSQSANYWNNLIHNAGKSALIQQVRLNLANLLNVGLNAIPLPIEFYFRYWSHGVSFWNHSADLLNIKKQLPVSTNKSLFLVSDMFSINSGWVEGALQNVELVYEELVTNKMLHQEASS